MRSGERKGALGGRELEKTGAVVLAAEPLGFCFCYALVPDFPAQKAPSQRPKFWSREPKNPFFRHKGPNIK